MISATQMISPSATIVRKHREINWVWVLALSPTRANQIHFSTGCHKPTSGRRLQRKANATKKISDARVCDAVYHACMFQKISAVLAWALLAFIVFATMAPLKDRPTLFSSADLEHIGAFAILGGLFCLAYPRHIILVCFIVLGSAVLLECLQTLTLDRHGTLLDAIEKIVGGAFSIFAARAALYLRHRKRSSQSQI